MATRDERRLIDEAEFGHFNDVTDMTARIARLSDEELVRIHRALSNAKVIIDEKWLPLLEAELFRRELIKPN